LRPSFESTTQAIHAIVEPFGQVAFYSLDVSAASINHPLDQLLELRIGDCVDLRFARGYRLRTRRLSRRCRVRRGNPSDIEESSRELGFVDVGGSPLPWVRASLAKRTY
jgi:hypothetical protein